MTPIKLPFWLSADETKKLITAATTWWQRAEDWVRWPLGQLDPLTCTMGILELLAWQRDLERFTGEPESLFRLRVKYALINAEDAGSKAGFIQIFARLGIGYVEIEERVDPVDWDVILLYLSDSQIAQNTDLLMHIIRKYGRTCRRYQLVVESPITVAVEARETGHIYSYHVAQQVLEPWLAVATVENKAVGHSWSMDVAKL